MRLNEERYRQTCAATEAVIDDMVHVLDNEGPTALMDAVRLEWSASRAYRRAVSHLCSQANHIPLNGMPNAMMKALHETQVNASVRAFADCRPSEQLYTVPIEPAIESMDTAARPYAGIVPYYELIDDSFKQGLALGLNASDRRVRGRFDGEFAPFLDAAVSAPEQNPFGYAALIMTRGLDIYDHDIDGERSVLRTTRPVDSDLYEFTEELVSVLFDDDNKITHFQAGVGIARHALNLYVLDRSATTDRTFETLMSSSFDHGLFDMD